MLKGKKGLVLGISNDNSIAWACASVNGSLKLTPFEVNRQSKFDPLDDIKFVH